MGTIYTWVPIPGKFTTVPVVLNIIVALIVVSGIQWLQKVFIPLDLFHILMCSSLKSKFIHTKPHNETVNIFLGILANVLKKLNREISNLHKYSHP